ncbi:MAG: radical SAM protein [Beijerinckiaceae bacterium]
MTNLQFFRRSFSGPVLVFGGVYSNAQALDALLDFARARGIGPQNMLCTGDIVAYGADASTCVTRIRELEISAIAGNCEEQLALQAADCGCGYAPGSACDVLSKTWFEHAARQVSSAQRQWMETLPKRMSVAINGLTFAVVHGALAETSRFVFASTPDRVKLHDIDAAGCDGVIAGHCGIPFTQVLDGRLWHNAGALGMPANDGTARVWCSVLTPGRRPRTLEIEHVALEYDHRSAAAAMHSAGLPEGYAGALESGLWPGCEVLPKDEAACTGRALAPGSLRFEAGNGPNARWPDFGAGQGVASGKFADPFVTAAGDRRAVVELQRLETLWINTGTLCNLACASCYIESTPRNDRLEYISADEVQVYLDEIARDALPVKTIGLTGGEPFMNRAIIAIMSEVLARGFELIVLTNAMKPMQRFKTPLLDLQGRYGDRLTMRISLDHYTKGLHEMERGPRSWDPAITGLKWLAANGFRIHIAGRQLSGEAEPVVRAGYGRLLAGLGLSIDASDPVGLVLFPEMDEKADVPEITEACWGILGKSPSDIMCSNARMVVKRKGADAPAVLACTLLAYDEQFELGRTLKESSKPVPLNHPHCAKFCVLGGAACSR